MAQDSIDDYLMHSHSLFSSNWNSIDLRTTVQTNNFQYSIMGYENPTRARLHFASERTIVSSLYNRIATDVAAVPIKHVRTNQNGRYQKDIDSGLNNCLNIEANIDQTGRELIFDAVISMFDEGVVALVPTETNVSLKNKNAFDVLSLRTAKILSWQPDKIQCRVYNDETGQDVDLWLPKKQVAIIQNPFYGVMNQQGSVVKRLIAKLDQADAIDAKNANAKLDMLIQVPYNFKSPALKKRGQDRVEQINQQIQDSPFGIGMIDGTEKVIQLNRSIENNLMGQIQWLQDTLYAQLGVSKDIFAGTADEKTSLNYYNQTIEPVLSALANEIKRKFLTKTARSQHQDIMFFRDPFRLVPVNEIAEIGDKFTRNEISSSNEMRSAIGLPPVDDPKADELRNKNLNITDEQLSNPVITEDYSEEQDVSEY